MSTQAGDENGNVRSIHMLLTLTENLPCEWSGLSEQACDSDGGRLGCLSLGGGAGRGHAPGGRHTTRSASGLRGQDPRSQENAEAPAGRPSWLPALRGAALGRAWLGRVGTVPEFQAFGNGAAAGTGGRGTSALYPHPRALSPHSACQIDQVYVMQILPQLKKSAYTSFKFQYLALFLVHTTHIINDC